MRKLQNLAVPEETLNIMTIPICVTSLQRMRSAFNLGMGYNLEGFGCVLPSVTHAEYVSVCSQCPVPSAEMAAGC